MIELLVVIAIIGVLSAIVLASLSSSRQKSRDAKRISDLGQIRLSLEFYFDRSGAYPSTTPQICGTVAASPALDCGAVAGVVSGAAGSDAAIYGLADKKQAFLPKEPLPPRGANGAVAYYYYGLDSLGANCGGAVAGVFPKCLSYALGANLERKDNYLLAGDIDRNVGTVFAGRNLSCGSDSAVPTSPEQCYDMKP